MDFNFRKNQPAPPEQKADEQAVKTDLRAEVVENVPVKQPDGDPEATDQPHDNPIHGAPDQPGTEAEMDRILEDVNQKVKSAATEVKPKKSWLALFKKKPAASKAETATEPPPPKSHRSLPLVIAAVAILVSVALSAAAYLAFSQESPSQPAGTSSARDPESASTSVTPEDIDNLSADLQSQIDSLNDSQDFDSAALSDSTLGL